MPKGDIMPKRFTDTGKWQEDWFIALENKDKFAWMYVLDNCDHAGIFKPNFKLFSLIIGEAFDQGQFVESVNDGKQRIRVLDNGRWFVEDFIEYQYGNHLNPNNRVHNSIINALKCNGVKLGSIRGLIEDTQGVKDKDKDKDKDNSYSKEFEEFWAQYPRKVAKVRAWQSWQAVGGDSEEIMAGLARHIGCKQWTDDDGKYVPHPTTWLNQRRWEDDPRVEVKRRKSIIPE